MISRVAGDPSAPKEWGGLSGPATGVVAGVSCAPNYVEPAVGLFYKIHGGKMPAEAAAEFNPCLSG